MVAPVGSVSASAMCPVVSSPLLPLEQLTPTAPLNSAAAASAVTFKEFRVITVSSQDFAL
jgi:hypothetical protein